MTARDRKRLIVALIAAPLIIAFPSVWPQMLERGSVLHNLDILAVFFALPFAIALWLAFASRRSS